MTHEPQVREDIGEVLRSLRQQKKLSQESVAYRAGVEQTYISKVERGKLRPSAAIARRIAQVLEIEEGSFFSS